MKSIGIVGLVFATAMLGACGGGSSPKNINNIYIGQLNDLSQTPDFSVTARLAQASGSGVNITDFSIGSLGNFPPCFSSTTSQTATFIANGSSNGYMTGTFEMTVSTVFPTANNVLTLTGNRNGDGTIVGTWVVTGQTGCSGNGAFTLSPPPPV
jgi:hypothetical protein